MDEFSRLMMRALFELNTPMTLGFALLEKTLAGLIFISVGYGLSRMLRIPESSKIGGYINGNFSECLSLKI
ncbi:MAG: hypothetical protein ACYCV0_17685 [Desulfitobacteriaceae bacterium]